MDKIRELVKTSQNIDRTIQRTMDKGHKEKDLEQNLVEQAKIQYKISEKMQELDDEYSDSISRPSDSAESTEDFEAPIQPIATRASPAVPIRTTSPKERARRVTRRKSIPERSSFTVSVWGLLKNNIGKDLSKIRMPVGRCAIISTIYCKDTVTMEWRSSMYDVVDIS